MDGAIEVVICHDILAVPYEDTTQYVWAGTQTFTIKHLEDADTNDKGAELNSNNATVDSNNSNSNLRIESVAIQNANQSAIEPMKVLVDGDPYSVSPVSSVLDNRLTETVETAHQNDTVATSQIFFCGVCDASFDSERLMHFHRVEHFGYFNGSYKKPCFACNQTFSSVKDMSEHLLGHFPKTEKDKEDQAKREKEIREARKRMKTRKRQKKYLKNIKAERTNAAEFTHENYPITNNDRLSESTLLSKALSRPRASTNSSVSSSPEHFSNKIINKSNKTNKYNSNHNKNSLNIQNVKSLAKEQPQQYEWECGVCESKFTMEWKVHQHRLRHFGYFRTMDTYKCAFCGELFSNAFHLSKHLLDHYMGRYTAVR